MILDRLAAGGFAELEVHKGHDVEFNWKLDVLSFIGVHFHHDVFHFMNYLFITKLDDFMNLNCIIDLNFVYDQISSMNDLGTQVEFMPDPEWNCLGFHCPCILQAAFTHICAY